jgi:inosose dehydratase
MENVSPLGEASARATVLERLKRACELSRDLNPDSPPPIETVLGGKPAEWEAVRDQMVTRLADWAKVAEAAKVPILLKPHVGGALHTPQGAVWLMEQLKSDWLKLAYDYSHFELQKIPLAESLDAMLPHSRFIHIKDTSGTAEKFQFLLPGDGQTDYGAYFKRLSNSEYMGPIVVEVSGQLHTRPDYDPVAAAKHSYAKIAPLLEKAGLRKMRAR